MSSVIRQALRAVRVRRRDFGNIEADFFTKEQLELTNDFIAQRGGGLLVLARARSIARASPAPRSSRRCRSIYRSRIDDHARIGASPGRRAQTPRSPSMARRIRDAARRHAGRESPEVGIAAGARGGRARRGIAAGRADLAVALTAGGTPQPLIAVQRYGQGRSVRLPVKPSWRWRMLRPATDTSTKRSGGSSRAGPAGAQGPVTIGAMSPAVPGITDRISVVVRDEDFRPVANAEVAIEMTAPNGEKRQMPAALSTPQDGRYSVAARFDQQGVYKIDAIATRGGTPIGRASRPVLVGGVDQEMTQPRLNESVLRRLAAESSGRYVRADQ